jgi:hypothetical protein
MRYFLVPWRHKRLQCSQQHAIGPYLEPAESSPHPHTVFLSKVVTSQNVFRLKFCTWSVYSTRSERWHTEISNVFFAPHHGRWATSADSFADNHGSKELWTYITLTRKE